MTANDRQKVIAAGFQIIRSDPQQKTIKVMTGPHAWAILEGPFPTKVLRDRKLVELLKDPKIITD